MRINFLIVLSSFLPLLAYGNSEKETKQILEKTSKSIKSAGDIEVQFNASTFSGTEEQGTMNGTIYLQKEQLHMVSENVLYWYDGKTLWTYVKANQEVNVSHPTITEQQTMNPYLFLNLYKKGYAIEDKGSMNINGKECYSIRLAATNASQKIQEMLLEIDKTNYHPLSIRMRTGSNKWTRIRIIDCKTKQKFKSDLFRFNPVEFPGTEVIDLR